VLSVPQYWVGDHYNSDVFIMDVFNLNSMINYCLQKMIVNGHHLSLTLLSILLYYYLFILLSTNTYYNSI